MDRDINRQAGRDRNTNINKERKRVGGRERVKRERERKRGRECVHERETKRRDNNYETGHSEKATRSRHVKMLPLTVHSTIHCTQQPCTAGLTTPPGIPRSCYNQELP